jgi:hypothetical protein
MAVRSTPPRHDAIATPIIAQQKPPLEAVSISTTQEWAPQVCTVHPTHATAVAFLPTPTDAAREARKNNKLTFLLHISGNFEDADFT